MFIAGTDYVPPPHPKKKRKKKFTVFIDHYLTLWQIVCLRRLPATDTQFTRATKDLSSSNITYTLVTVDAKLKCAIIVIEIF